MIDGLFLMTTDPSVAEAAAAAAAKAATAAAARTCPSQRGREGENEIRIKEEKRGKNAE